MSDPGDLELVQRANRGDADSFEALYRRYRDWVVPLAERHTGNHDDALDVPLGTVKSRLHAALAALKGRVGQRTT